MRSLSLIGAGHAALALGRAFVFHGGHVVAVANRGADGQARARSWFPDAAVGGLDMLLPPSDLVLVAVSDTAIEDIDVRRVPLTTTVAHASGALAAAVLGRANVASIHPLLAIADAERAAALLASATFGIEGDAAGLASAQAFVHALGASAVVVPSGAKPAYHAAAVLAANALVASLAAANDVAPPGFASGLAVLARSALDNIVADGIEVALTGPVLRGDVTTVQAHLTALAPGPSRELYRAAAQRALVIAVARGLTEPLAKALRDALSDPLRLA